MNTYSSFNFSNQSWNSGSLSDNYQNSFTYDANGNILTQYRKTAKSSNKVQDQLTYHYQPHTNQLTYVSDAVDQNHYTNDFDDQASDNYLYDKIGNLVKDKSESIDTILWNVYGKIKEIRRVDTSSKPWLAFEYNPSGQRAVKIVKPDHNDQLSWIYTYYIYDATGNVMATYTRRNYFDDIGDSSFAFLNDWIYNELGLTDLQDFMESKFSYNSQFINDWIEFLSTNELAAGVFDEFQPDDFLGWDATLVPAVLSNFAHSPNASPTENDALLNAILSNQQSNFVSSVLNSGTAVLNNALTGILSNDPTDLLLNCMATNNPVGLNSVYVSLGGSPTPPPTNASRIAYIRSFPPPVIAAQISAIESISNLQNYFSSCLNTSMIYNSWNSAQPNISFIDLFDAWSGLGDTSLILDVLKNHYSNDAHLRILLKEVRTLQQLYQMASSSNYSTFVNQSINSTSYVDLSFVMYQSSALTFSSYLKMVRTHFGSTTYSSMMSDIGELLKFGKDITWQEQHIYGSSRLGMYQSGQLLVKYKYKYSDTLQIYLDSVKFDRNTARAMRRMSQKQYELTNHLGNVLSTVLDRKTPITATGGSGSSTTITHYEGDVVFATDYYPFGSPMSWSTPDSSSGRMYSGAGYRYGFNGQERDDEVVGKGNSMSAEFWQYDGRLGRRWNVDPHASNYPGMSPYSAMGNNPISFIDPDGRDIVYFNTMGQETHRVKSTTEFRTYIQSTATIQHPTKSMSGWKEVPMPNIIQERTQSGENVSGSAYQENDYLIAARTGLFNHTKNNGKLQLYTEKGVAIPKDEASKIPDLDPTLVKSIAIQESHNGTTGVADIMTANNTGDFDPYKSAYGLTKGETMDVNRSLYLGIRFLATKGFRGGITYDKKTGEKTYTFQGWFNAAGNYNGGGVKGYQGYVEEMFNNSKTPTSNDY